LPAVGGHERTTATSTDPGRKQSKGWNHQQVAPPGISFNISSIAQVGNSAVIVADGPNVGQRFYWQPVGGSGWHCQVVPSGSC
jgi:hypothetical protein